jgi:hypothetical protein
MKRKDRGCVRAKEGEKGGGGGGAEEFEWVKGQRGHLVKRLSQNLGLWGQRAELLELLEHFVLNNVLPSDSIIVEKQRRKVCMGEMAAAAADGNNHSLKLINGGNKWRGIIGRF